MNRVYKLVILELLFVGLAIGQYKKGEDCQLKGKPGVCKLLAECPQADDDTRNDIYSHQCEYDGSDAVVCCPVQEPSSLEPKLGLLPKDGFNPLEMEAKALDDFGARLMDDVFNLYRKTAEYIIDEKNRPEVFDRIIFDLYTPQNPQDAITLDLKNLDKFRNRSNKIVFLIHGWLNNRHTPWMSAMKDAFLSRDDGSWVVIVDWKWIALQQYSVSAFETYKVGKRIGGLLVDLYKNYGVDKKHFLIVGHSLGGQISGFVGETFEKETKQKLPRIIALDPAGPLFIARPEDKRLNEDHAEVVEVIHTNGGLFGFLEPCGTIDFFVNGGMRQPGCIVIDPHNIGTEFVPLVCHHMRAVEYFTEAVQTPSAFVAKKCLTIVPPVCLGERVAMGNLSTTETGKFFLITNARPPYGIHHHGIL